MGLLEDQYQPHHNVPSMDDNQIDTNRAQDGPYLLQDSQMHSALRLYDDTAGAFMVPTKEVSSGVFEPLRLMGHRQQCLGVAVSAKPTSSRTNWLSGKRIAVKEVFEIKGIAAALGNRAFEELATPAAKTAPAIEKLLKLGVKLVGTTKTSSMISREDGVEGEFFLPRQNFAELGNLLRVAASIENVVSEGSSLDYDEFCQAAFT